MVLVYYMKICLTGGILTCFGMFGVRQCFRCCTAMFLSIFAQKLLTGGALVCFCPVCSNTPDRRSADMFWQV